MLLIAKLKRNTEYSEKDSMILFTYGIGLVINYCYCWRFALFYLYISPYKNTVHIWYNLNL